MPLRTASANLALAAVLLTLVSWLSSRKITSEDAPLRTCRPPLSPVTWSEDRSRAIWLSPRCTLSFWVGAWTLRSTILSYVGLSAPVYLGFFASTTCVLVLNEVSVYGPEPAELVLRYFSAPSEAVAEPPWACTVFALRMPSAGLGRMNGSAGFAFLDTSVTVEASVLVTVTPSSRNDGLPLSAMTRCSENTTSSAVTALPSANVAPDRRCKVSVLPSADWS